MGYRNIIVHVGINDLCEDSKGRKPSDPPAHDIPAHFKRLTQKLEHIQALCPASSLIVAPLLPTKSRVLSDRAMDFNNRLFDYTSSINTKIRSLDFEIFADQQTGLLKREWGRYLDPSDTLHLGRKGYTKLAEIYIGAIFRPKIDARSFSSLFTHDSAPSRKT